jgi:hypothetical protein
MNGQPYLRLVPVPASRPDLRYPRRRDIAIYRIRADLDDAQPPIWRRAWSTWSIVSPIPRTVTT